MTLIYRFDSATFPTETSIFSSDSEHKKCILSPRIHIDRSRHSGQTKWSPNSKKKDSYVNEAINSDFGPILHVTGNGGILSCAGKPVKVIDDKRRLLDICSCWRSIGFLVNDYAFLIRVHTSESCRLTGSFWIISDIGTYNLTNLPRDSQKCLSCFFLSDMWHGRFVSRLLAFYCARTVDFLLYFLASIKRLHLRPLDGLEIRSKSSFVFVIRGHIHTWVVM